MSQLLEKSRNEGFEEKDEVGEKKEVIDKVLKDNREWRKRKGVASLYRHNGKWAGYIVDDQELYDHPDAADVVRQILVYNPFTGETYRENLHRIYGGGRVESLVSFEDPGVVVYTARIEPGLSDDSDDSNFKYMVAGDQADRLRRAEREAKNGWDAAERASNELEKHKRRLKNVEQRLEEVRNARDTLEEENVRLSRELNRLKTEANRLKTDAISSEIDRRRTTAEERKQVEDARREGEFAAMSEEDKVKKRLEMYRKIRNALDGVTGNKMPPEERERIRELQDSIDNLERIITTNGEALGTGSSQVLSQGVEKPGTENRAEQGERGKRSGES